MTPETPVYVDHEKKTELASSELFLEALKTLPIMPEAGEVTFAVNGIQLTTIPQREHIGEDEQKYLDQCADSGVIPYTKLKFKYDNYHGIFRADPIETTVDYLDDSGRREAVNRGLVKGGRFNLITFDIGYSGDGTEGFGKFKERVLDSVGQEGYQVQEGDIWIACRYSHSHYNEGLYEDTSLKFSKRWGRGMRLKFGTKLSADELQRLAGWFDTIESKYRSVDAGQRPLFEKE